MFHADEEAAKGRQRSHTSWGGDIGGEHVKTGEIGCFESFLFNFFTDSLTIKSLIVLIVILYLLLKYSAGTVRDEPPKASISLPVFKQERIIDKAISD